MAWTWIKGGQNLRPRKIQKKHSELYQNGKFPYLPSIEHYRTYKNLYTCVFFFCFSLDWRDHIAFVNTQHYREDTFDFLFFSGLTDVTILRLWTHSILEKTWSCHLSLFDGFTVIIKHRLNATHFNWPSTAQAFSRLRILTRRLQPVPER